MTVAPLVRLAEELKLSPKERVFAATYAAGPAAGNGTASARLAGYQGDDATLAATASRALRRVKVRRYLAALTAAAVARAEEETGRTVATLEEVLTHATAVMRFRLGDLLDEHGAIVVERLGRASAGIVQSLRVTVVKGEDGSKVTRYDVEVESALAAAQTLINHYTAQPAGRTRRRRSRSSRQQTVAPGRRLVLSRSDRDR